MNQDIKRQVADLLYEARENAEALDRIVPRYPDMTLDDAYDVMRLNLARREREGAVRAGYKIGATNAAIMAAMETEQPLWTRLYRDMLIENGGVAGGAGRMVAPKIEPEIAFVMGRDLKSETADLTPIDVLLAVAGMIPAIEVADCRVKNWEVKARDSVMDIVHASHYVLGDTLTPLCGQDLRTIGCVVEKNDALLATAASAAVLGSPVNSLCWLANTLILEGEHLRAGDVILSGSLTSAFPAQPGDLFRVIFAGLGSVAVTFG